MVGYLSTIVLDVNSDSGGGRVSGSFLNPQRGRQILPHDVRTVSTVRVQSSTSSNTFPLIEHGCPFYGSLQEGVRPCVCAVILRYYNQVIVSDVKSIARYAEHTPLSARESHFATLLTI